MTTMVYVDNDNIQFTKYEDIITSFFNTSFYKIFINEYELSKIDESIKNKHKFIVCNNNGKNSLDISLTIECMKDLVRNNSIHTYVIVSNDTDFIPLCKELKEYGKSCILFTDRIHNEATNGIYDKIVNIGDCKRDRDIKEHKLRELERQKVLEQERRINKTNNKNDIKITIKSLLDEYFTIHPNLKKISYDKITQILNANNIDYTKEYKKLGKFLKKYLPDEYRIDNNGYILNIKSK
tara:strand:+ start:715 stop:1428 length:714 start_codon:yes stop_codon:yes gene_type:complete